MPEWLRKLSAWLVVESCFCFKNFFPALFEPQAVAFSSVAPPSKKWLWHAGWLLLMPYLSGDIFLCGRSFLYEFCSHLRFPVACVPALSRRDRTQETPLLAVNGVGPCAGHCHLSGASGLTASSVPAVGPASELQPDRALAVHCVTVKGCLWGVQMPFYAEGGGYHFGRE